MLGTFIGVLIQGLIQTYINFDGTLSSWWTKIATGILLFAFIGLQQAIVRLAGRSRPQGEGVANHDLPPGRHSDAPRPFQP